MGREARRLRFFRRYDDGIVHLRMEVDVMLCGLSTTGFGNYVTGPADAPDAPAATCPVCAERLASPDLAAELLAVARRTGIRQRLLLRR
jgi:hypothetical protein